MNHLEKRLDRQRAYFDSGATRPLPRREAALRRLLRALEQSEGDLLAALERDLGKHPFEGYETEVGLVRQHLRYTLSHLRRWAGPKLAAVSPLHFPAGAFIRPESRGLVLIIAPWNYPVQLCLIPLIDAIAAGNCAVLKPSAYAPATSRVLRELVESCFAPDHIAVVEGGRAENEALLEQKFDYIFFTGSVAVGRLVMEKAARWLTPVTLELGGKSPCIIDQTADLPLAAKRLAFGKYLNAGQTCVAPDYVLVHRDVHDGLLALLAGEIAAFYGSDPLACPDYGRIVNEKHFHRLMGLMDSGRVVCGGTGSAETLQIAPTVLADVSPDSPVMSEEIFGPVLPVLAYESLDEAVAFVNARPKPLALYLFTTDKAAERRVLRDCSFGGGCINDTIIHLATSDMGFGGVGESGMGSYHGKLSFDTFTHYKSIVKKSNRLDLPVRYQPYTKEKERMLRRVLK